MLMGSARYACGQLPGNSWRLAALIMALTMALIMVCSGLLFSFVNAGRTIEE
jgi:hypothetical protein